MSERIRPVREMINAATTLEVAYFVARDLLRTVGNDWLDYGIAHESETRYNIARNGEKMALALAEAFGRLATLAEKEEA